MDVVDGLMDGTMTSQSEPQWNPLGVHFPDYAAGADVLGSPGEGMDVSGADAPLQMQASEVCGTDGGRFTIDCQVGSGAFAHIWRAVDQTGREVAIKDIGLVPPFAAKEGTTEYHMCMMLEHPNIIRILHRYATSSPEHQYLVFEYADGGDMFMCLESGAEAIDESFCRDFLVNVCSAIQFVHSRGVVHCDIKLENMLRIGDAVKLCDFGLSGFEGATREGVPYGTAEYMAPELLTLPLSSPVYRISQAQDCWSFGVVLYAVLFADLPWVRADNSDADFAMFVRDGITDHSPPWSLLSSPMRDLFRGMLALNPQRRTTFAVILQYLRSGGPWLQEVDSDEEGGDF